MSGLLPVVRKSFELVTPARTFALKAKSPSLVDCLMSGLAMFSLKSDSLLQFDNKRKDEASLHNLNTLFGIQNVPSDTCMRERLDEVDSGQLRGAFKKVFSIVQETKLLQEFQYLDGYYLVSGDGTGFFSSSTINCKNCCVKQHGKCTVKFITKDMDELQSVKKKASYLLIKVSDQPWNLVLKNKVEEIEIALSDIKGLQEILANKEYKELSFSEREEAKQLISNYSAVHNPEMAVEYYHHMYCGAIVHPDKKTVLPFAPEPILKTDGSEKNDCERNASKRFYADLRREHPHLKIIVVEDGLASNAPHLEMLQSHNMRFIVGAKPGDHKTLFDSVDQLAAKGSSAYHEYTFTTEDNVKHHYRYVNNIQLNASNPECFVNFFHYTETKPNKKPRQFSWVTDIEITNDNISVLMKAARARWKIENETFNTLKNQGYNFEHNFGHGKKHLSSVFASLLMLAFSLDQICEASCTMFNKALGKIKQRIRFWEDSRSAFASYLIDSWEILYRILLRENRPKRPLFDTS